MSLSNVVIAQTEAQGYIANIGVKSNLEGLERVKQILVAPPFCQNTSSAIRVSLELLKWK
ncbi:hypothetical protein BSPWISOXPB_1746 [uncultured Gammaproteobacteria bacterium]|nr:hypothetical protein BSPWISOXPB_1746 [uncultured Gammaproteobacteria bacterium]